MVARAAQAHHHGDDGRHAGRRGHRLLSAFEGRNTLLERTDGRVGVARVDVARHFTGKTRGSVGGGAEHIAGGEEHRVTVLTFRGAVLAGAHSQGIESYAIEVAVQTTGIPFLTHALLLNSNALSKIQNRPLRAGVYSVVVQVDDRADRLGLDLRGIVTRLLDLVQVGLVDIPGDVLAVEHRTIELLDLDLATADRFDQVR